MKHRTSLVRIAAAGTAIAALALTGCAATSAEESAAPTTLRLGVVTQLASFAPWEASWANQSPYLQAVYDTLLRAEPDGSLVAGLATDWEWDDTKTVLTLTLRDDVTFTDGEELTAQVVADYLTKFRDGTSENASFLAGMTSAEATDDRTVTITLAAPDPALPVYLSQNAGLVGSPAMLDAPDAQTTPIGSGPYTLNAEETVVGSSYAFEANPDYWDADSVHYDEIDMTFYGDPTALMNAVKGGQLDATNTTSAVQIPEAEAAGFTAEQYEQNWIGYLLADRDGTVNPAFGDVRVRQAFNYALDREGLVQALAGGYGTPTTQVFGVNTAAYDEALDEAYPYDPEKARELLAEAGYADGVKIVMPSSNFVPESEFAIYAEQLGAVGFEVEGEPTGDDLFGRMLTGSWAAFSMLLQTDPTAWQTVQFSLLPESTWNPFHVADPTVVELADVIRSGEPADADAAAAELNEYIVDQAWFAPVYRPSSAFLTNESTEATVQADNAVPYLWNIRPAQ
ncbi:peptide ABC transporter substrate-binding protein [Microbacterium paludicola]|uniref:Peptide ABC transporter substrate-binding protein n=1 Tax=Microbacterium paludicola TaxID=300019 RepID=A0A4Y9FNX8_9MICO|nr:ABC transporter substrate-binding protein [Microbacterium paludicola]MBF0817697.1 peptide ABC transporter substrate-binding protein [Microbacterium paludicola]TFU30230.1 peptide ABC transporter substrate-binding protein [Microbacterium paludicola]